jgi:hypothetical protein
MHHIGLFPPEDPDQPEKRHQVTQRCHLPFHRDSDGTHSFAARNLRKFRQRRRNGHNLILLRQFAEEAPAEKIKR